MLHGLKWTVNSCDAVGNRSEAALIYLDPSILGYLLFHYFCGQCIYFCVISIFCYMLCSLSNVVLCFFLAWFLGCFNVLKLMCCRSLCSRVKDACILGRLTTVLRVNLETVLCSSQRHCKLIPCLPLMKIFYKNAFFQTLNLPRDLQSAN